MFDCWRWKVSGQDHCMEHLTVRDQTSSVDTEVVHWCLPRSISHTQQTYFLSIIYDCFIPGRGAKYCNEYVCLLPSVLWHCWLGIRKSIRPIENWVMGYWHSYWSSVVQMICIWSSWCHCHPSSLPSVKSRMVYLSGAGLPRLSWKKAVKRTCVCENKLNCTQLRLD